ncbi:MAG TPA: FHA domain-containing protein [Ktedonobacterales bacterium]|nr:FHA domain-containing protein [Ktedonobacterales bacterium]
MPRRTTGRDTPPSSPPDSDEPAGETEEVPVVSRRQRKPETDAREQPAPDQETRATDDPDDATYSASAPDARLGRPLRGALVELCGREDGRVTLLRLATGERALIGRTGEQLTLQLGYDRWVSATHAQVWIDENGDWWLEDLKSRNGTEVQEPLTQLEPFAPVRLPIGAIFRVGHTDLLLTDSPEIHGSTLQLA